MRHLGEVAAITDVLTALMPFWLENGATAPIGHLPDGFAGVRLKSDPSEAFPPLFLRIIQDT